MGISYLLMKSFIDRTILPAGITFKPIEEKSIPENY